MSAEIIPFRQVRPIRPAAAAPGDLHGLVAASRMLADSFERLRREAAVLRSATDRMVEGARAVAAGSAEIGAAVAGLGRLSRDVVGRARSC